MADDFAFGIADALSWMAGEIGEILDVDAAECEYEYAATPTVKIPQSKIPPWSCYDGFDKNETISSSLPPKFAVDESINAKIFVGSCNILRLEVGAVVTFLDEMNKFGSSVAKRIQAQSGKELNYSDLERLRCGDVLLLHSYNVGSEYVIYAISPRYSHKYPEASDNILNMCIREALKAAIDVGIDTIAFPLSIEKSVPYPTADFANTLLRTIRRWLEIRFVAEKIRKVFLVGSKEETYPLIRRYFPRNEFEERLSGEINYAGNEFGEIVKEERSIRISTGFSNKKSKESSRDGIIAPVTSLGESYRIGSDRKISQSDRDYDYYMRLSYSISRLPINSEMERSKFITKCGNDRANRPIIAVDAKKFAFSQNHEYALCFALRALNPFLQHRFVILVTNLDASVFASSALLVLLRDLCQVLGPKRLHNLAALYFHRSSWAIRGLIFLLSVFIPEGVWEAAKFVDSAEELRLYLEVDQLELVEPLE